MALTPYCQPDEVRAALGVNAIELPDTVLNLPIYKIGLMRELQKLATSLPAAFSTIAAIDENQRTAPQAALHDATRLFSAYAAARQVGASMGSMIPKDVGDGKATISRFSDAPYKDVMARVEGIYGSARAALAATLADQAGSSVTRTMATPFLASGRSYDPVTG